MHIKEYLLIDIKYIYIFKKKQLCNLFIKSYSPKLKKWKKKIKLVELCFI